MKANNTEVKATACPKCTARLDDVTGAYHGDNRPVAAKDITICAYCATVLEFTEDLDVKPVTEEALNRLTEGQSLLLRLAVEVIKKKNLGKNKLPWE